MYKSPELDKIRARIDTLDNTVHDLLLERADLVMQISEEKKKNNIQIVQPAREARMIRRLMARHRGPLPEETIVRIWRELVGSISLLQTGLSVSVFQNEKQRDASNHYWDMARDYFGSVLPMNRSSSINDMLNDTNDGRINFAVLPFPTEGEESPWWPSLLGFSNLNIIQMLPYGSKKHFSFENFPALVVAKSGFDSSDNDHSMILIETKADISRARIIEAFQSISLTPLSLLAHKNYFLIEVKEYMAAIDDRLDKIKSHFNVDVSVKSIGGFPTPLTYLQT
jgi:chorismate mutase / prephenate dehydratase